MGDPCTLDQFCRNDVSMAPRVQVEVAASAAPQRPRLMSMVVVGGTKRTAQQPVRWQSAIAAVCCLLLSQGVPFKNAGTLNCAFMAQDVSAPAAAQPVEYEAPGIAKRPAPVEDDANPVAKKRARRLFGALMGTLAKARRVETSRVHPFV